MQYLLLVGILFDSELSFDQHISSICSKVSKKLHAIRRIATFMSFNKRRTTCASFSYSYISETCRHFKTRIEEHIKEDNKSHIFKQLHSSETYFDSYNSLCFKIIDKANSKFDLKIKEA